VTGRSLLEKGGFADSVTPKTSGQRILRISIRFGFVFVKKGSFKLVA
jgi:hypothetical protein